MPEGGVRSAIAVPGRSTPRRAFHSTAPRCTARSGLRCSTAVSGGGHVVAAARGALQTRGQRRAAAGHARSDRADRAADDVGGLEVRQSDELCQHQRLTLLVGQLGEQLQGVDDAGHVVMGTGLRFGAQLDRPAAAPAEVFETNIAGHAQHPGHDRAAFPTAEVGDDAHEGLLHQVVGVVGSGEVGAEPPHVGLHRRDEPGQRLAIAFTGLSGRTVGIEHDDSLARDGNLHQSACNPSHVNCESARELLSAQLDQETTIAENMAASRHLGDCVGCSEWLDSVTAVTRALRLRAAEEVPNVVPKVLASNGVTRPGRLEWVRYALGATAATEFVLAARNLLFGHGAGTVHDARHIGSFGVALAIGLMLAAWRPVRAYGLVPIVAALVACTAIAATIDISSGRADTLGEAHHLLEVLGLVLVWMLSGRAVPTLRRHRDRVPAELSAPTRS